MPAVDIRPPLNGEGVNVGLQQGFLHPGVHHFLLSKLQIKSIIQIRLANTSLSTFPKVWYMLSLKTDVIYVQEAVTHLYSNLLYEMGHYFLDTQ